ncbi:hypothetical protein EI77_02206 [Prosthecobacter fusiformis]|uniref:Uncharacterized protein n=1 Tax=Prosthecobacter fusiformis TaxID=48464 RepID=A0A4R7S122_9BACT|nr:hypothetical protein [Prosthecobacter fusiformis]TDU71088.1 hypothetical protein EI77_02206 [Prosthecobacter fusiformis]
MSAPAVSRLPEDHPAWKDLRPLGYECARWLAAMGMLQNRWKKGRLGDELTKFLRDWMPQEPVETALPETFDLTWDGSLLEGEGKLLPLTQPGWQALLHLHALRDFWTAELRASHYAHLLQMIPQAWFMDPTPLPPGSVIAGLGITGWAELPRLEAEGRQFIQHPVGENKVVLSAVSAIADSWRARYQMRDGQIVLQEAFLH